MKDEGFYRRTDNGFNTIKINHNGDTSIDIIYTVTVNKDSNEYKYEHIYNICESIGCFSIKKKFYKNNELDKDNDMPALIIIDFINGNKYVSSYWFKDGKLHRTGGMPAVIMHDGELLYYVDNKLHREAGPAIIYPDGSADYFLNDEFIKRESHYTISKL